MAPDSRYHLRSRSATTNLTTMLRDSVLRRYDLRPRPAVTYSQTVSRSTRQQKRYRRSKRALLNPTAPSPPSLSTLQLTRVPYLPPEIVCMILSYYSNHNEAITLLPTRASIEKQAAFNEPMSRLPPKKLQKALGHRIRGPFKPSTTRMPITPPYQSHNAPEINLLLTNKLFHDEFLKQYYSKNIFTFLLGDHDSVWRNVSESKRAHVRHFQLESLWELDLDFFEIDHINYQAKATLSVKPVWGRSEIEALMNLYADDNPFPNLQSITQRIRLRFNKNWAWPTPQKPTILITLGGKDILIGEGYDLLLHKEASDRMKSMVVTAIKARWEHLNIESYLTKMEIGFMYSQILEWDKKIIMKPFLSLV